MLRTIVLDHEYLVGLNALFDNPMAADDWQRTEVEDQLAREERFDTDIYPPWDIGITNVVARVWRTAKTQRVPSVNVFFTVDRVEAVHLRALAISQTDAARRNAA